MSEAGPQILPQTAPHTGETIEVPDLMHALELEITQTVVASGQTTAGKPVSEQEADAVLEWVGSDSLDWDKLWKATQASHSD